MTTNSREAVRALVAEWDAMADACAEGNEYGEGAAQAFRECARQAMEALTAEPPVEGGAVCNRDCDCVGDCKMGLDQAPALTAAGVAQGGGEAVANLDRVYRGLRAAWEAEGRGLAEGSHAADLHSWANDVYAAWLRSLSTPAAVGGDASFEAWFDPYWRLWRNYPENPNVARLRRAWEAAIAAEQGDGR